MAKLIQELATPKKPVGGPAELAADAGPIQSHDRPDGRALAGAVADRAAVHGPLADRRPRSHRQGRGRADARASEESAAEDPVRHRSIRHARRQGAAVRRSGQRRRHERTGSIRIPLPARRRIIPRTWQPLLAAWGVDYDPTKVVGDLELGLEVRSSMQGPPTPPYRAFSACTATTWTGRTSTPPRSTSINVATAGFLAPHAGAEPPNSSRCS